MDKELITTLQNDFNAVSNILEGTEVEFWYARELQSILGYDRWENFFKVIIKAKIACENSNIEVLDHFRDVKKMVTLGSGATREIKDIVLTRYACYLVAQNGDSKKEQIAFAQTYFAIQTRKQELIEQRMELEDRLKARAKLRESEAVSTHRPLADFLPTVTITAKNLATEITNHNVKKDNLYGERSITSEHVQNNESIRNLLTERGIKPEELPASEDLKKLERKVKSDEKKLINKSALPKSK